MRDALPEWLHIKGLRGFGVFIIEPVVNPHLIRQSTVGVDQFHFEVIAGRQPFGRDTELQLMAAWPRQIAPGANQSPRGQSD